MAEMMLDTQLVAQTAHYAMGTVMTHKAYGIYAENSLDAVCHEVARLEDLLSRFLPDSEISRINLSAGLRPEKVSFETFEVLSLAADFSRLFPGCFDVTIGPLVSLWKMGKDTYSQPDDFCINQVLSMVNEQELILDPWEMTAELAHIGQSIDLGGIGKGYAGDKVREIYKRFGIASAYSNLGGNVITIGAKPDGNPWQIGIQHPRKDDQIIGSVPVVDQSVVTSGDYQRYFTDNLGKRHHHILNPRTGYPAELGLISVSIIADKSVTADALSTMVFVAGMEKGLEIMSCFPGTEAVLVDSELGVYATKGLQNRFQGSKGIDVMILA